MQNGNITIKLRAYHPAYIANFMDVVKTELTLTSNLKIHEIFLPRKVERFTVLRSPHVDKKARDQFERVIYQRLIVLKNIKLDFDFLKNLLVFLKSIALGVEVTVQTKNNV